MAVLASQLEKMWTLCPVDVEEDGGEGEMVRGEEPFWRRTKPRQEEQACMCMHASALAGLRVPVVPGWWMWIRMDGSRQMRSHLLQVGPPGISSPKIGFDRALPRSRGSETGRTNKQEIERAKPKPREGVSVVQGPISLSPSCLSRSLSLSVCAHCFKHPHNTRTNPSPHIIRSLWGFKWCKMIAQSVKRARIDKHIIKRVSSS